jgi:hypothetical protein
MDDCKLPASALSGIGLTQVVGFTHLIFASVSESALAVILTSLDFVMS